MTEQDLFVTALRIEAPADRSAYLDRACGGDDPLRHRVEALLRAHALAGDFLGTPAVAAFGDPAAAAPGDTRTGPSVPNADEPLDFLTPSDKPGSIGRLGHYEVQEVVGRGGMGVVLRAFDETLHRVVAVKVMAPQLAASATARRRFTREARAAAAVTHDHVVTIHAVEDTGPLPYIVMQFVAGSSLQERLDRTGPLPLPEILRIGMQTAAGLAAAHAQGLVHRDVKPANILLENGVERVKLTDFGLARAADDASLTQSGTVAGTPSFMSPEQAEGKALDLRSDLFSLGSVLYAMCTGRPPFRAGTTMGVLKRVCEETPTPIRETNPEVPEWLVAVVENLHAKDPAARFQSATEVAELLGRHLAHVQHPSVAPLPVLVKSMDAPPAPARLTRRGRRWAAAAAVLVAMFAVLGTTEATGVTKLRATILRVFTPDGTVVLEAGDPDGKRNAPPALPVAKGETGAFVLLAVGAERKFDTLAEAVLGSTDGDTIEIRGNGPFVCSPIKLKQALTIRAGGEFRPVLLFAENLRTDAPLVLEGLELQRVGQKVPVGFDESLVATWGSPSLHIVNCRFREHLKLPCVRSNAPICVVRNCEFLNSAHYGAVSSDAKQCVIDNCLEAGGILLGFNFEVRPGQPDLRVQITRSTLRSSWAALVVDLSPVRPDKFAETGGGRVRFDASGTVFDAPLTVAMWEHKPFVAELRQQPKDAETLLLQMLGWRDQGNLYAPGGKPLIWVTHPDGLERQIGPRNLADWKRHWVTADGDAVEGVVKYQGGDLLAKLRDSPAKLTPEDFRLRTDSAGYRAGKDGKDLGADVDLVGPGPAYERWKKTPAYQQWLKETGQIKK